MSLGAVLKAQCPGQREQAGPVVCLQGWKERTYASSGEAITSLPVSIPLSTVQPSKLPVSIPLASVVLPSRAEKVVSEALGLEAWRPQAPCVGTERAVALVLSPRGLEPPCSIARGYVLS